MRKNRRYNRKCLSLACIFALTTILFFPLNGCGKKEDGRGTREDVEQTEDMGADFDFVIETKTGNTLTFQKFEVVNNTDDSGRVYEVTVAPITEEEIRDLAEKLFDDGSYEVLTPYEVASWEELRGEREYYQNLSDQISVESGKDVQTTMPCDCSLARLKKQVEDNLAACDDAGRTVYAREPEELLVPIGVVCEWQTASAYRSTIEDSGQKAMLRGMVNGIPWLLEVLAHHTYHSESEPRTEIYAYEIGTDTLSYRWVSEGNTSLSLEDYGKNLSSVSLCEQEARAFAKRLDFENAKLENLGERIGESCFDHGAETAMGNVKYDYCRDGYLFSYSLWDEDCAFRRSASSVYPMPQRDAHFMDKQGEHCAVQPEILIDTSQNRVRGLYVNNYVGTPRLLGSEVVTLTEDNVVAVLKDELAEHYEDYFGEDIGDLEFARGSLILEYHLLPYVDEIGEIHYNLMPTWVFEVEQSVPTGDGTTVGNCWIPFGFCALDGSIFGMWQDNAAFDFRYDW